jgi:hypothetical protein
MRKNCFVRQLKKNEINPFLEKKKKKRKGVELCDGTRTFVNMF